jgi:hypothetical protein
MRSAGVVSLFWLREEAALAHRTVSTADPSSVHSHGRFGRPAWPGATRLFRPLRLCAFLSDSVGKGGLIAVLALDGLFLLITQ